MNSSLIPRLILPFVIIIATGVYVYTTDRDNDMNVPLKDRLWISYTVGGGMDMYQDGDRFGYKFEIRENGSYALYRRYYREAKGDRAVTDSLFKEGTLPQEEFDEVQSLIPETDFFSIAERLPEGSPHEIQIREPAESVTITLYDHQAGSEHTVRAHMGADRRHYPETFNDLNRAIRHLMQKMLESD